ncbi:hypothetical protein SOPP22_16795 [Shewanella sp. OPT22]|nr:hypothetical protein SOPP22_16795 [Shewanella sp. OPT22]
MSDKEIKEKVKVLSRKAKFWFIGFAFVLYAIHYSYGFYQEMNIVANSFALCAVGFVILLNFVEQVFLLSLNSKPSSSD